MEWRFFLGACLLTGALLVPLAGIVPVAKGLALAGLIRWVWSQLQRRRPS